MPRILLLVIDATRWCRARHISYSAQLGIEEGLAASGATTLTATSPWFPLLPRLLNGRCFDQVWVDIAREEHLDPRFLEWLSGVAPVRVGFMQESLQYTAAEIQGSHELGQRRQKVFNRLPYLTHVVACDEQDAAEVDRSGTPAIWWPQAIPRRYITPPPFGSAVRSQATFGGALYGTRHALLTDPAVRECLVYLPPAEGGTPYPLLFNLLHLPIRRPVKRALPPSLALLRNYTRLLRTLRRRCFLSWLRSLQTGLAVVNLPHMVKAYPGRVVEAMAAGRPVISWEIPNRPRNRGLFRDEEELLLFPEQDPACLAQQIQRIAQDPGFADKLARQAQAKLLRFHTMEHRVRQTLDWLANGSLPVYQ